MKIAIIGSRELSPTISLAGIPSPSLIISGGAIGVDQCAKKYANGNNIPLLEILPDYNKFGKIAPIIRNRQIVNQCDQLLIYWNGKSTGTKSVIDYAKKKNKKVHIVIMNKDV